MINKYRDHAANERTYLAWIRTSIAIMAFGFLIEKFNLFVDYLGKTLGNAEHFKSSQSAEFVGMLIFIIGVLMIISATVRFFRYKKFIESEESYLYAVKKTNIMLSTMMVLIAIFLLVYMSHQFLA